MFHLFTAGAGLLFGAALTLWLWRRALARERHRLSGERDTANPLIENLRASVAERRDELEAGRTREQRAQNAHLNRMRERLEERRAEHGARHTQQELDDARLEARGNRYTEAKARTGTLRARIAELEEQKRERLEGLAEQTATTTRTELSDAWVQAAMSEREARDRDDWSRLEEEASARASALLARAIRRYDGESHLERISNSFSVPPKLADALGEANGQEDAGQDVPESARMFREQTGCFLELHADRKTLVVRGDDPLGRERARRLMKLLLKHERADPAFVEELASKVSRTLDREVANAGSRAVKKLGLSDVAPEVVGLLGRLKFRLSFSQNQWKHSIEVAYLTGLLAAELRLAITPARRAGLMHDMGKALTHEREGAHAVIGAEIAERCGESEAVRHAIGAHHYDETPTSALAFLLIAADAMSGARPGARRESTSHFNDRVRDIERIARRENGVLRVDVMHGGREVRVWVAGDESGALQPHELEFQGIPAFPDREIHPLAKTIARNIEG
ncbi:MAG: HDIG domain-containing metalloprotein, partial [Myxococcota bacterium]